MSIQEIFSEYQKNGLLVRTDDGNTPLSQEDVNNKISQIKITDPSNNNLDLSGLVSSRVPPYSASLISSKTPQVAWYNFTYSEQFKASGTNPPPNVIGNRMLVGIIFKNNRIKIYGGGCWDTDSNARVLGNIPVTESLNRSNPFNIGAQVGDTTVIRNNNPFYNPMFYPRTSNNKAVNYTQVGDYLNMIGEYKQTWVNALKTDSGDAFNSTFGNYINDYSTGVEPEILVTSNTSALLFNNNKFVKDDIQAVAFVTDATEFPAHTDETYKSKANDFLNGITGEPGWVNGSDIDVPIVVIKRVALPNVPVDGTSVTTPITGTEWIDYLTGDYSYLSLTIDDFKMIYEPPVTPSPVRQSYRNVVGVLPSKMAVGGVGTLMSQPLRTSFNLFK